jgi:hypothetical protein
LAPKPEANLRYLDVAVAFELWREWGLEQVLRDIMPPGDSDVAASEVVEILTSQRLVAPDSKLAAVRWFPHTVLPELLGIAPSQFNNTRVHRVLGDLEAVTPTLMAKLPRLYRERHGAFVSMFIDVTDAWFVGHGPKAAVRAKTKEGIVTRKIGIVLLCNERGYPLRWEVIEGNCSDSVAMTAMLQTISGLQWMGDAPVVLDRAMGKTAHIRMMAATKIRFLTALTRTEFSTYAPALAWTATEGLAVEEGDNSNVVTEAALRIEAAGMQKVDDSLFVVDFGVVGPKVDAPVFPQPSSEQHGEERTVRAMRLCREVERSVIDGRYDSYTAAGAALGLKQGVLSKYRELASLTADIQRSILDGKATGSSLADLIRVARLQDPDAQRAAFAALAKSNPPSRKTTRPKRDYQPDAVVVESEPLQVRVVAYFNPERFVEQRRRANERLHRIQAFIDDLNTTLSRPRSTRTRERILTTVDQRLRRDNLIDAFEVTVDTRDVDGRCSYQVKVKLDEAEWSHRRRYDGFSVLVGRAELPHTAEQLCQLYRDKDMVEKDFQVVKSVLEVRPIRHRNDEKVSAHVTLCMLALLLERTLRDKLAPKYTTGEALELLERCRLNRYPSGQAPAVYTTTQLDKEQRSILSKLRLQHLADDDHLAARITPR